MYHFFPYIVLIPLYSCDSLTNFYLLFLSWPVPLCPPYSNARHVSALCNYFFTVVCQISPQPVASFTLAFPYPPSSLRMEHDLQSVPSHPLSAHGSQLCPLPLCSSFWFSHLSQTLSPPYFTFFTPGCKPNDSGFIVK